MPTTYRQNYTNEINNVLTHLENVNNSIKELTHAINIHLPIINKTTQDTLDNTNIINTTTQEIRENQQ